MKFSRSSGVAGSNTSPSLDDVFVPSRADCERATIPACAETVSELLSDAAAISQDQPAPCGDGRSRLAIAPG